MDARVNLVSTHINARVDLLSTDTKVASGFCRDRVRLRLVSANTIQGWIWILQTHARLRLTFQQKVCKVGCGFCQNQCKAESGFVQKPCQVGSDTEPSRPFSCCLCSTQCHSRRLLEGGMVSQPCICICQAAAAILNVTL